MSRKTLILSAADLVAAVRAGEDLRRIDYFAHSDLSGANLAGAYFRWACFVGADLSEANLSGADLLETNLRRAYMNGANLHGARVDDDAW